MRLLVLLCDYMLSCYVYFSLPQDDIPQQDLFSRIDASKLNSAIGNAAVLGKMEVNNLYHEYKIQYN